MTDAEVKLPNNSSEGTSAAPASTVQLLKEIPIIESAMNTASCAYDKVKDSNPTVNTVITKAENAVHTVIEKAKPVVGRYEDQIKKVDTLVASGISYIEEKFPAVKTPTGEVIENAKHVVQHPIETACSIKEKVFPKKEDQQKKDETEENKDK